VSWQPAPPPRIEDRISVEPDGTVTALSGKVDFGQGIRTAFAQIVADELDVDFEKVRVVLGDTSRSPYDFGTFGSQSIRSEGSNLRNAAAAARTLLVSRASARLGVGVTQLETADGAVRLKGDGSAVTYADLVKDGPLEGLIPEKVTTKSPDALRVVGRSVPRREGRDIVTGQPVYVTDVRLPGMLRGAVLRPPHMGAALLGLDDTPARSLPGVIAIVRDGDFVGAVAERYEQALAAVAALRAEWDPTPPSRGVEHDIELRRDEGVDAALAGASRVVEAAYTLPYLANAPIGPSGAVADVRPDGATIYSGSQRPFGLRSEIAGLLGLDESHVQVVPSRSSGTYGRNNNDDAPAEAARLSRAVGRPVLVQWTREDEFAYGTLRPAAYIESTGALGSDGRVAAWRYRVTTHAHILAPVENAQVAAFTAGSGALPTYDIEKAEILLHVEKSEVRTSSFRSLAGAENVFAIESLMDELALLAGADPIDFRLSHISDPRFAAVVRLLADRSGWAKRRASAGRGLGFACTVFDHTYIAQVADVSVDDGQLRIHKLWCAIDAGLVINPDGLRNQVEGAMMQGASFSLMEEVAHRGGRVAARGWESYPIATFLDAPEIEVIIAADPRHPATGAGEAGIVPVGAAVANAVFAATGIRCRELPLSRANIEKARRERTAAPTSGSA
jgi:nicotinate dehydrogenase subunit B